MSGEVPDENQIQARQTIDEVLALALTQQLTPSTQPETAGATGVPVAAASHDKRTRRNGRRPAY